MPAPRGEVAAVLKKVAESSDVDPFTIIAQVKLESDWDPYAINVHRTGTYVGLGQHRLSNYDDCRGSSRVHPLRGSSSPEAVGEDSPLCLGVRNALLDYRFNLEETARAFNIWRALCKDKVGTGLAVYWLQGYGGFDAQRGTVCGHKKGRRLKVPERVLRVMAVRKELVNAVRVRSAREGS